ncbi:hypothetical protein EB796_008673 [Bugula neritina]|uniref:Uncharacterized protein n=1 Tax=Bugula neritina TaxID=10212 RepID=A0A7J7K5Z0_BUGNE|nr:hypothetical protein EB796_008673 [Bugula neritina]
MYSSKFGIDEKKLMRKLWGRQLLQCQNQEVGKGRLWWWKESFLSIYSGYNFKGIWSVEKWWFPEYIGRHQLLHAFYLSKIVVGLFWILYFLRFGCCIISHFSLCIKYYISCHLVC